MAKTGKEGESDRGWVIQGCLPMPASRPSVKCFVPDLGITIEAPSLPTEEVEKTLYIIPKGIRIYPVDRFRQIEGLDGTARIQQNFGGTTRENALAYRTSQKKGKQRVYQPTEEGIPLQREGNEGKKHFWTMHQRFTAPAASKRIRPVRKRAIEN